MVNSGVQSKDLIYKRVLEIHRELGINISCFGIGKDYDEELMKSVAENGSGDYFFLDNLEAISKQIGIAMDCLTSLIGKNAKLTISPKNGLCKINKIIQCPSSKKEDAFLISCGDICEDDTRNIVLEVEVDANTDSSEVEFLELSLVFEEAISKSEVVVVSTAKIGVIDDEPGSEKYEKCADDVLVAVTIAKNGENDDECLKLIRENRAEEAKEMKKKGMNELKKVVHLDSTGWSQKCFDSGDQIIQSIEKKEDRKQQEKQVGYSKYKSSGIVHRKCF